MTGRSATAEAFGRDWTLPRLVAPAARLLSYYYRARVSGVEQIPRDRPVIYVGKHPRTYLYLETILLGFYAFWDSERPPFRVLEQTNTTLHRTPLLGSVRRRLGPIQASARRALRALERGESVLIFPGGTRELYGPPDRLQWDGQAGFARLAMHTGAPVVPFAIAGADRQHPWRVPLPGASVWLPPVPLPVRLEFRFGAPMEPPPRAAHNRRQAADAFADAVAAATCDLIALPRGLRRSAGARGGATPQPVVSATTVGAEPMDLDPRHRPGSVRVGSWLSRYHRVRVEGTAARGPCIYVTHHGAGYLNGDLAVAVYQLAWRDAFERGGPVQPLRVVAAWGHAIERAIPGLARIKRNAGLIDPSEASCLAALERGEQLLITPGGHRESSPRARDYRLLWDDRHGFVRLALQTGVPIVPLAVVGGYAAYPGVAIGKLSFWCPLPLPARLQIAVGEPIVVTRRPDEARDATVVKPLQQEVRDATQALYDRLLAAH